MKYEEAVLFYVENLLNRKLALLLNYESIKSIIDNLR